MHVDLNNLEKVPAYNWIVSAVVPRPIAWILTKNENETFNLAPFSYFNVVSSSPVIFSLSIANRRDGTPKDTLRNLLRDEKLVLHIPCEDDAVAVTESATPLEPGVSEVSAQNLSLESDGTGESLPILKGSKLYFHGKLLQKIEVGPNKQPLVLVEASSMYVDDSLLGPDGDVIDSQKLRPLSRLGGDDYGFLGDISTIKRKR